MTGAFLGSVETTEDQTSTSGLKTERRKVESQGDFLPMSMLRGPGRAEEYADDAGMLCTMLVQRQRNGSSMLVRIATRVSG